MLSREATFARLDALQTRSLDRLKEAGSNRALLVELLEASCLLELAKIDTSRIDPTTYLQLAVDVVAQMYPVQGIAATVTIPAGRTVEVSAGERPTGGRRYPLTVGALTTGVLVAGAVTADLGEPNTFFTRVSAQIADGLTSSISSEQLRRQAATANAAAVAADLDRRDLVEGLEELALSLASFPSVIAAELAIEHPALGPPLRLRSGYWDTDGHAHAVDSVTLDLGGVGRLTARLRSQDASSPDEQAANAVLEHLAASLARVAHTHELEEQAESDPMTGLGNRRRLQRALEQALGRAERYGEQVAVLLIDLDKFKPVNDELGHDMGDAVLVACAHALRERTRAYDEIIRLGGDEFVIVAPTPDLLDALRLADDVREEVAMRAGALLPADWGLTATVGVAIYPDAGTDPETLLRAADAALYRAKNAGRDAVMVAEPLVNESGAPAPRSFLPSSAE